MLETITGLIILSVLIEGIVEYFIASKNPEVKQPWLKYVAGALGIAVCLAYRLDLLATLGLASPFPFVGSVLTGFIIGRGSNYLNDFISRVKNPTPSVVVESADVVKEAAPINPAVV